MNEPPFAWLVPPDQHDPGSAYQMLERLSATAVEIHQAEEDFTADGVDYPAGTFIMYTAQPYRPHLMDMMERQVYPDRVMYPGGPAEPPYDMAGWTLPLQMGVRHVEVATHFDGYWFEDGKKSEFKNEAWASDISFRRPFDESRLQMPPDARI